MKKCSLFFVLVLFLFAGCSQKNDVPRLEDYTWTMSSIQSKMQDGQAIAYGPQGSSTLETAVEIDMECVAAGGKWTITDITNGREYTGSYKSTTIAPEAIIYEISVGEQKGMAVVAMTTYLDKTQKPTFIINLDDYVLNFFAKEKG